MKLNKNFWIAAGVVTIIILFFANGCRQRQLGRAEVKQSVQMTTDKRTDMIAKSAFDSIMKIKSISEGKHKKTEDSANSVIKSKDAIIYRLQSQKKSNNQSIENNTAERNNAIIDSAKKANLIKTTESIVNAGICDSINNHLKDEIKLKQQIIDNDNIDATIDNIALQDCITLNRADAKVADDNLQAEKQKVKKRGLWIGLLVGINAVKDAFGIYYISHY